jgi:predicted nucleic acid-binding protein
MIVVADTSPLNYLVLVGEAEILKRLYGRVVIPEAVLRELQHPQTPAEVAVWIAQRPGWLQVQRTMTVPDDGLRLLGQGEREAITLAGQHGPECVAADGRRARPPDGEGSASRAHSVF